MRDADSKLETIEPAPRLELRRATKRPSQLTLPEPPAREINSLELLLQDRASR